MKLNVVHHGSLSTSLAAVVCAGALALTLAALPSPVYGVGSSYFENWAGEVGSGPDSAWGAENATDPNNGAVHYTNNTPAMAATNHNPVTLQVISDPTATYGRALQMTIQPLSGGVYQSSEISTKLWGGVNGQGGGGAQPGNNIEYGHIEASIKVAGAPGSGADTVWPAFWMLGDNISTVGSTTGVGWPRCGEIDIMETKGSQETVNQAHLHCETKSGSGDVGGGSGVGGTYTLPSGALMYNAYHTYAIDWSPGKISWSIDGLTYLTETTTSSNFTNANGLWAFDGHPFYLIFDICQGGGFAGISGHTISQPLNMDVAYVSVTASPEPTSAAILLLGAGGLLFRRRR